MNKDKDTKTDLSFPEPFDVYNQEMAADIEKLRAQQQKLENLETGLGKAMQRLKDNGPARLDIVHSVQIFQDDIRTTEGEISALKAKTYDQFERIFAEHEVDPELANQVIQVLDKNVYPERFQNNTPIEEQTLDSLSKNSEAKTISTESLKSPDDNRHEVSNTPEATKPTSKNDYTISLLQRRKMERETDKAEIGNKANVVEREAIPQSNYLNYQLKLQKPIIKEQPKEKLVKDFSKNNKDISPDKD
ncbi:hypothetical protein [Emticicia sp. BO119]|uniref:hypothetical protein n=1 Tax=Emticicia sp. BO119 TaxID=2757768 RepID=UPI0015F0D6FE|nr:hypothetical protein [Emticicia sp. BO119]MBA4853460.1 hypothetical protein [Emticicia sp. BO119]